MYTITLQQFSHENTDLYFDLMVTCNNDSENLHLEFTTHFSLILEDGFCIKDINRWPLKNFKIIKNKLFTEEEIRIFKIDYYNSELKIRGECSKEMAHLKQQIYNILEPLLDSIEIKVSIVQS